MGRKVSLATFGKDCEVKNGPEKRKHYRERYRQLRAQGLCGQCAKIPSKFALCTYCREQRNASRNRRGRKPETPEYRAGRYWKLRNAGLCVSCGCDASGKSRCETCLLKANEMRNGMPRRTWYARQNGVLARVKPQGRVPARGNRTE